MILSVQKKDLSHQFEMTDRVRVILSASTGSAQAPREIFPFTPRHDGCATPTKQALTFL
jgi:hypothetical protein